MIVGLTVRVKLSEEQRSSEDITYKLRVSRTTDETKGYESTMATPGIWFFCKIENRKSEL